MRLGTFDHQDVRPSPCSFDYVIRALQAPPDEGFKLVYADATLQVDIYQNVASRCG